MTKFYLWLFKKILNKISKKQIRIQTLYQIIHDIYVSKISKIDCNDYKLNIERSLARNFERTQDTKNERILLYDVVSAIDREEELEGELPERFKKIIMDFTPDKIMRLLQLTVKITKINIATRIINLKRY
jgi:hypothetical protein